jgi:hypothetical protein
VLPHGRARDRLKARLPEMSHFSAEISECCVTLRPPF